MGQFKPPSERGSAAARQGTAGMDYAGLAEVWRGPALESVHFGAAAVANAEGEVIYGWGDTGIVTFPRSSLKPIQAIALVESGAADAFRLAPEDLALACASHRGEPMHTDRVAAWLGRLGMTEDALACGPDFPSNQEVTAGLIRAGAAPSRVFHNCSGKHCGFLTVARHRGWPVDGYSDPAHPSQQHYLDVLSDLLHGDAHALSLGVDGCTLPAPALSMADMARVMARYAAARTAVPGRDRAIRRLQDAMRAHPRLVAGTGQANVRIGEATGGRIIMKGGAEGYVVAFVPDQEIGIALKIADGNSRARVVALLAMLRELKLLSDGETDALAPLAEVPIRSSVNEIVGRICACTPPPARVSGRARKGGRGGR
jgi:L-asparaginase II